MQVTYFLTGLVFNLFCHITLFREKVTSYEKFNHKLKLYQEFQRFNAKDENIKILKNG